MGNLPFTLGILLSGLLDAERTLLEKLTVLAGGGRLPEVRKEHEQRPSGASVPALVRRDEAGRLTH